MSYTLSAASDGLKTLRLWALDASGIISSVPAELSFQLDRNAPVVSITAPMGAYRNTTATSFTFSADDNGGVIERFECSVDGAVFTLCASPLAKTLAEGSHTFSVRAIDTASNTSTTVTHTLTIDTTPPVVTFTTPASSGSILLNSQLSNVTIAGTCSENGRPVIITGAASESANCASNAWSSTVDLSGQEDGTLTLTVSQTDIASNVSALVSKTFVKDIVAPAISVTTPAATKGNVAYGTFNWTMTEAHVASGASFSVEFFNGATWSSVGTKIVTAGPNSATAYTLSAANLPNVSTSSARVRISFADAAGNLGTATSGTFIVDSTRPILSGFVLNGGVSSTTTSSVPLSFSASDANKVTHICFKYNSSPEPILSDACWTPIQTTGVTASTTVSVSDYFFRIGLSSGLYSVFGWMRDSLGNVSQNTGTAGVDMGVISFISGTPPVTGQVIAGSSDTLSEPQTDAQLTVPAGQSVYIKWTIQTTGSLGPNPIQLAYTTDDATWTEISSGLPNSQGSGCTISGAQTGCYRWTNGSPSTFYFKVRIKVTDSQGLVGQNSSPALNATAFKFHVGNTESGIGGSASAGVFMNYPQSDVRRADVRSLVVHPSGTVYFRDATRGILKVDPVDGILRVLVPTTGVSTGDGGPVAEATLRAPSILALDYQNNLLIMDYNRIRKINLTSSPQTIQTFIGGGDSAADLITDPLQLKLNAFTQENSYGYGGKFHPVPNGDLIFKAGCAVSTSGSPTCGAKYHWYHRDTNTITAFYVSGQGIKDHPELDVINCSFYSIAPILDSSNNVQSFVATYAATPASSAPTCSFNSSYNYQGGVFDTSGRFLAHVPVSYGEMQYTLGKNGVVYGLSKAAGVIESFNPETQTWNTVTSTGLGSCPDGEDFSTCRLSYDDVYVDQNGKIYMPEVGSIRTVTDDNKLITLMGQRLSYGDGLAPSKARFGDISSIGVWNDGTKDRLVLLDQTEHRIREVDLTASSTVATIAGTGSSGGPSTALPANAQPIFDVSGTIKSNYFGLDPSGNVYLAIGSNQIGRLKRSTGRWERFIGGGATNFYTGDGLVGTAVKSTEQSSITGVLGYGSGKIVTRLSFYTNALSNYPALKLYDTTTGIQSPFASKNEVGLSTSVLCAVGTSLDDCGIPQTRHLTSVAHDPIDNAWLLAQNANGIRKLTPGGVMESYLNVPSKAVALRKTASEEYLYYCDTTVTPNKVKKMNMRATPITGTHLPWPVNSISCDGYNMIYSESRNSLIFIYQQNGLNGVIEYPNP